MAISSLEGNYATLRGHLGKADGIGELGLEVRKVSLGHPTGDRARASDVNRDLKVLDLLHELPERREPHAVHGIDNPRPDQAGRLAKEEYAAIYLRTSSTRGYQ